MFRTDGEAWLVDLDGTLYRALGVRLAMAAELVLTGRSAIRAVQAFRREQERMRVAGKLEEMADPFGLQLARAARELQLSEAELRPIIHEWMFMRPGKWLRLFRRRGLLSEIANHRQRGGQAALVSDYPAREKLAALNSTALFDVIVASGEPGGPSRLKPDPEGYLLAAQRLGVEPDRCLVIGDRADADGEAARRAGMRFRRVGGLL